MYLTKSLKYNQPFGGPLQLILMPYTGPACLDFVISTKLGYEPFPIWDYIAMHFIFYI
jgi:hypothetical protein